MKGLSTETARRGLALLVQTQWIEAPSCYIETLVYDRGRLLHTRKTSFARPARGSSDEGLLARAMDAAHRDVLKDLSAGRLDHLLSKARP